LHPSVASPATTTSTPSSLRRHELLLDFDERVVHYEEVLID
jgi:hypothetical protein